MQKQNLLRFFEGCIRALAWIVIWHALIFCTGAIFAAAGWDSEGGEQVALIGIVTLLLETLICLSGVIHAVCGALAGLWYFLIYTDDAFKKSAESRGIEQTHSQKNQSFTEMTSNGPHTSAGNINE